MFYSHALVGFQPVRHGPSKEHQAFTRQHLTNLLSYAQGEACAPNQHRQRISGSLCAGLNSRMQCAGCCKPRRSKPRNGKREPNARRHEKFCGLSLIKPARRRVCERYNPSSWVVLLDQSDAGERPDDAEDAPTEAFRPHRASEAAVIGVF